MSTVSINCIRKCKNVMILVYFVHFIIVFPSCFVFSHLNRLLSNNFEVPRELFRRYFGKTVRLRVGRILHDRRRRKREHAAVSDASDSSSSRSSSPKHSHDDDDDVKDSAENNTVKPSVSAPQKGAVSNEFSHESPVSVKSGNNMNTKKKRRIYNNKKRRKKRLGYY